jgi:hypothetical protein
MNKQLQDFARAELKAGLAELPEDNHRTFKLMYARDYGKRFLYGYYQACAYLASHMDDHRTVRIHQSTADEYHRQWAREQIQ